MMLYEVKKLNSNSVKTWVRYVYLIIDYVISKTGLVLQG